jgi:hypothetical protein
MTRGTRETQARTVIKSLRAGGLLDEAGERVVGEGTGRVVGLGLDWTLAILGWVGHAPRRRL